MTEQVGTAEKPAFSESQNNDTEFNLSYYQEWLVHHQNIIDGVKAAVIYLPTNNGLIPTATLAPGSDVFNQLTELAENQFSLSSPQVSALGQAKSQTSTFGLVYPVQDNQQQLIAFVAMAVNVRSQQELTQAITLLELSTSSLEVVEYQQRSKLLSEQQTFNQQKVDILASVLSESSYSAAAVRLVTEMTVLYNCDRTSIGEYKRKRSKLQFLSHSAQFGKKMNQVRLIENVMDECIDQGRPICFLGSAAETESPIRADKVLNGDTNGDIVNAHKALSEHLGDISIMSLPIYLDGKIAGAVVVEGKAGQVWRQKTAEEAQSLVSLVIPTLADKKEKDKSWLRKTLDATATQLGRLLGPRYLGRKLVVLSLAAICYLLATWVIPYKLSTDAVVESAELQAVVAPYDGYINEATARAGDRVEAEQLLVKMDDRDLRLEKLKWLSEQGKLNRQYLEAVAVRDRAKINIINAQQQQVTAQLELINSQLKRGALTAPYPGLIVSGDLSQRLGSAISKGDVLFEVAPDENYRIKLLVKDSRISELKLEQTGELYLSALPEQKFAFKVNKVTPLTEAIEGTTYFVVEADLLSSSDQLRPGMEGIGKVYIDDRLGIKVWTRELVEWVKIQLWTWWG
ncbi:HlyD family efflux transporter periplasmic adaptor subunit [Vibrio maerlii]|uniref:HlyD family efflux transporter periplasmic adaptor subunit n=1 Tax=Vibrio maerlii TaxID=2231648 RepID=UPI000E3EB9C3|nr:HlyD family efflux transporter periplasmic adaptor subunit [Vibrio maerlii]